MLKFAIASVFLGANLLGFTGEIYPLIERVESSENYPVYLYIRTGNEGLYCNNYSSAFENFSKAELVYETSLKDQPDLYFWIFIGKAIAADNLGMRWECEESIGSLVLIANSDLDEESLEEDDPAFPDTPEIEQFFKELISHAKSSDVKEFMEQISEELSSK